MTEIEGKRARRTTRYSGDFQIQFKDLDSSDDEDDNRKNATGKKRARNKECPGCGTMVNVATKQCASCDFQFTSKSMLMNNPLQNTLEESKSIRERFPFEPEREEDGSLILQSILGRRPRKSGKRWSRPSGLSAVALADMAASDAKFEYEYLVKYKSLSYLHVQWLSATEIDTMNLKSRQTLYRYLTKLDRGDPSAPEDGEIDPSFVEVERVLDMREEEVNEVVDDLPPPGSEALVPHTAAAISGSSSSGLLPSSSSIVRPESISMSKSQSQSTLAEASEETEVVEESRSVHKVFQPAERCRKVLEKIWEDPASLSFREPVDTALYEDYLDVVEEPMSLRDVLNRLDAGDYSKYQQYKRFQQDMRLIWQNCKTYNLYKSQIWHTAHAFSLMFERLFQAWVVSFADGSIRLDDPLGQPWQSSCRRCLTEENEDKMLLCDHCDASFHIYCLRPQLPAVPEEAWVCERCSAWFARTGTRLLSAQIEDEARAVAESAGLRKVVRIRKKKYLVKWRGLSYRDCTWETARDINDDEKIAEYHKLNDSPPADPPLTQAELGIELSKDRRTQLVPALARPSAVQDLDAVVYAQIRAMHFLRFLKLPPSALLRECGPAALAYAHGYRSNMLLPHVVAEGLEMVRSRPPLLSADPQEKVNSLPHKAALVAADRALVWMEPLRTAACTTNPADEEVADVLAVMLYCVARHSLPPAHPARPRLPEASPTLGGEIEVCVRRGVQPLGLKLTENKSGRCVVTGFRPNEDGFRGPVEATGRVKPGDMLVAIDGQSVLDLPFQSVVSLLSSRKVPFIYLRFFRCLASTYYERTRLAPNAPYNPLHDYLDVREEYSSNRPASPRSLYLGVHPSSKSGQCKWRALYYDGTTTQCIGEYSDELTAARAYDARRRALDGADSDRVNFSLDGSLTPDARARFNTVTAERLEAADKLSDFSCFKPGEANAETAAPEGLEADVGLNSSLLVDEDLLSYDSGDSDSAAAPVSSEGSETDSEEEESSVDDDSRDRGRRRSPRASSGKTAVRAHLSSSEKWASDDDNDWRPVREGAVAAALPGDGPMSRLLRAVNQSDFPPVRSEWTKYILELGYPRRGQDEPGAGLRRIDQLDPVTGAVIETWDGVTVAARLLNLQPQAITKALLGQTDTAGGFRWRLATLQTVLSQSLLEDGEEGEARKEDDWRSKLYTESREYRSGGTLRDYQLDGLNWLLRCWYSKRSSILADEMGLGKTVQVVTFLDHLFERENIRGPFLVTVPLSTIEHWKRETEGWSPMGVCLYHDAGGGRDMRDIIREYEWYYKGRSRRLLKFHVLITTYDDLIRDYEELAEIPWRVVVVDEAHRLRNTNSKLLECMRSVVARGLSAYGYQHRILMTGTPLQNNTAELWSLLNFIEPAKFPDAEKFAQRFGNIQTQEQVEGLQRRIAPHLLRRVKEDVARDIPPKEETIIDVELTTMQKQYYRAILEHNHSFLMQSLRAGSMPKLMNIQMELRKCCNHPFLISGIEQTEMETLERTMEDEMASTGVKKFDRVSFERRRMEEVLVPTSGKMVLLDKLLPKLRKEGHKVLIFSQMVKMIDLIDEYCEFRGYSCERLDGRVGGNDRQKAIDRFNRSATSFVFLLSTRAGGVGINLTAADTVVIFDSDWNPQNDVQAMARCHRIGQSKHVTIYRLITRKSFEAEMFKRASKKLGLEQAVLGSRQFNDQDLEDQKQSNKIDAREMEQLLRDGFYAVLLADDEEVKEFFQQDIDKILEQRSHVLVTEGDKMETSTDAWADKKNKYKTKKSLFTGELAMEHAEIDVNDPDFWRKVLPDLVTPDIMLERLASLTAPEEEEEGPGETSAVDKYMRDLAQMMEGMLDLNRRGQLPDRERAICLKLLLRITLREEVFEEGDRLRAQEWLAVVEGSRRRNRVEVLPVDKSGAKSKKASAPKKAKSKLAGSDEEPEPEEEYHSEEEGAKKSKAKAKAKPAGDAANKSKSSKKTPLPEDGYPETARKPAKKKSSKSLTVAYLQLDSDAEADQERDRPKSKSSSKKRKIVVVGDGSDDGEPLGLGSIVPKRIRKSGSTKPKARVVRGSDDDFADGEGGGEDENELSGSEDGDRAMNNVSFTVSQRGRIRKNVQVLSPLPAPGQGWEHSTVTGERRTVSASATLSLKKSSGGSKKKKAPAGVIGSGDVEGLPTANNSNGNSVALDERIEAETEDDTQQKIAQLRQKFLLDAGAVITPDDFINDERDDREENSAFDV